MTTDLFVLCLVAVPLLLIALIVVPLFRMRTRSIDALVGITATMLAILPIRTVLVPSEISSLTLVDFALAFEIALLAAAAAFRYLWPRPPAKAPLDSPPSEARAA